MTAIDVLGEIRRLTAGLTVTQLLIYAAVGLIVLTAVNTYIQKRRRQQNKTRRLQVAMVDALEQRVIKALGQCIKWSSVKIDAAQDFVENYGPRLKTARKMMPALREQARRCQIESNDGARQSYERVEKLLFDFTREKEEVESEHLELAPREMRRRKRRAMAASHTRAGRLSRYATTLKDMLVRSKKTSSRARLQVAQAAQLSLEERSESDLMVFDEAQASAFLDSDISEDGKIIDPVQRSVLRHQPNPVVHASQALDALISSMKMGTTHNKNRPPSFDEPLLTLPPQTWMDSAHTEEVALTRPPKDRQAA